MPFDADVVRFFIRGKKLCKKYFCVSFESF
jgi:hypothetical protein